MDLWKVKIRFRLVSPASRSRRQEALPEMVDHDEADRSTRSSSPGLSLHAMPSARFHFHFLRNKK
ncbi:hypothetical protein EYF80_058924 [Liparis tanakae]|uniref:Uncharacterized protein n=1 Tax=Liparis tanakae TaxID=230148 RepID=A0A4Z2EQ55_9TELE|nr:hypothetical protein EYF80_058924 [Liparis tanakae]